MIFDPSNIILNFSHDIPIVYSIHRMFDPSIAIILGTHLHHELLKLFLLQQPQSLIFIHRDDTLDSFMLIRE